MTTLSEAVFDFVIAFGFGASVALTLFSLLLLYVVFVRKTAPENSMNLLAVAFSSLALGLTGLWLIFM